MFSALITGEEAEDLVEYTLLLGFIALAGAATYVSIAGHVDHLWQIINDRMVQATT